MWSKVMSSSELKFFVKTFILRHPVLFSIFYADVEENTLSFSPREFEL